MNRNKYLRYLTIIALSGAFCLPVLAADDKKTAGNANKSAAVIELRGDGAEIGEAYAKALGPQVKSLQGYLDHYLQNDTQRVTAMAAGACRSRSRQRVRSASASSRSFRSCSAASRRNSEIVRCAEIRASSSRALKGFVR